MIVEDRLTAVADFAQQEACEWVARRAAGEVLCGGLVAVEVQRVLVVVDYGILLVPVVNAELEAVPPLLPAHAVVQAKAVVDVVAILLLTQSGRLVRTREDQHREKGRIVIGQPERGSVGVKV